MTEQQGSKNGTSWRRRFAGWLAVTVGRAVAHEGAAHLLGLLSHLWQ